MPPGIAMHFTGTTRIGAENNGRSVADVKSRVWLLNNLYIGGAGKINIHYIQNFIYFQNNYLNYVFRSYSHSDSV